MERATTRPTPKRRTSLTAVAWLAVAAVFLALWLVATVRSARTPAALDAMPEECVFRYRHARTAADTAMVDGIVFGGGKSVATSCGLARRMAPPPRPPGR